MNKPAVEVKLVELPRVEKPAARKKKKKRVQKKQDSVTSERLGRFG